ncbi:hypothetical protein JCM9279_004976 [Rhodotorula babjevae]
MNAARSFCGSSRASTSPSDLAHGGEPILADFERRGVEVRSCSSAPEDEDEELVAPEFVAFVREKAATTRTATAAGQS